MVALVAIIFLVLLSLRVYPNEYDGFGIEFKSYEKSHTIAEDELKMLAEWIKSK